ncbi:RNA polymerase factor sigma-54 [bacterium]
MELRQSTTLKQTQTLGPQFYLEQKLLQMPVLELLDELRKELSENPALELEEVHLCPTCNKPLQGTRCENCGKSNDPDSEETELFIKQQIMEYDPDQAPYEGPPIARGDSDRDTPMTHFATREGSFHDYLIYNFLALDYPDGTEETGKFLIRTIDDDGYMKYEPERVMQLFDLTEEELEDIVRVIQTLEPAGVGARNAREALLIQMDSLAEEGKEHQLARTLIEENFQELGGHKTAALAKKLDIPHSEVQDALEFIRRNLNPFPGRAYLSREPVQLAKPAIVIKFNGREILHEVIELSDFRLKINRSYLEMYQKYRNGGGISRGELSHIRKYFQRAKFYQESIERRRQTLEKIARALCQEQREFLVDGLPAFNSELTRGKLATKIDVHESTVSRAMSGKFVQVPGGEILSFDFFFDSSIRPKEIIKNIIAGEEQKNPISDKQIGETLKSKGINLARRTVAKYREELKIPSSYERRRT